MTSTCRWLWVFVVTLVLVTPTLAQEYRGRVQGTSPTKHNSPCPARK